MNTITAQGNINSGAMVLGSNESRNELNTIQTQAHTGKSRSVLRQNQQNQKYMSNFIPANQFKGQHIRPIAMANPAQKMKVRAHSNLKNQNA